MAKWHEIFMEIVYTGIFICLLILVGSIGYRIWHPPVPVDNNLEQIKLPNGWQQTMITRKLTEHVSIVCISFHSPVTNASMGYCTDNL